VSGFSIVEIMVVMVILGILGSGALMSARNMFPRMRVDRASSRLAYQLQLARSEAIANNQTVYVDLDADNNLLTVSTDLNRNGTEDDDEVEEILLEETSLIRVQSDWTTGAFNAYGQFITTPGQREIRTVRTQISAVGGTQMVELTLRGSGAITKR
jgi:prepilin-type N-terminal cleavage/methylation domain-containing protein